VLPPNFTNADALTSLQVRQQTSCLYPSTITGATDTPYSQVTWFRAGSSETMFTGLLFTPFQRTGALWKRGIRLLFLFKSFEGFIVVRF